MLGAQLQALWRIVLCDIIAGGTASFCQNSCPELTCWSGCVTEFSREGALRAE